MRTARALLFTFTAKDSVNRVPTFRKVKTSYLFTPSKKLTYLRNVGIQFRRIVMSHGNGIMGDTAVLTSKVACLKVVFATKLPDCDNHKPVFLNRRAAARYRGPGINYTGPREVLMEFVILVF